MHDHDRHSEARLPCVQASEASISNKNVTPGYAQTAQGSAAHHDCLACQWSAQSASIFTLPGSLGVPVLQPVPVQPQAFSAPASLALPALRGRGPPSL